MSQPCNNNTLFLSNIPCIFGRTALLALIFVITSVCFFCDSINWTNWFVELRGDIYTKSSHIQCQNPKYDDIFFEAVRQNWQFPVTKTHKTCSHKDLNAFESNSAITWCVIFLSLHLTGPPSIKSSRHFLQNWIVFY